MNPRIERLRRRSLESPVRLSGERARLVTEFHRYRPVDEPAPLRRARCFLYLCEHKTIYIGHDELIVGERGPEPGAVPTFPELTCHSLQDLELLHRREKTRYLVDQETVDLYREEVIPYWSGRSMRKRLFAAQPQSWHQAYRSGVFTEFMEQRAPGHTAADGKIYRQGLAALQAQITGHLQELEALEDAQADNRRHQLQAMHIAAEAAVVLARRHAEAATELAAATDDGARRAELLTIADVCRRVPEQAPRTFHEALQMYWFCHLGVITELNGWDAYTPGHLDQHLEPFYRAERDAGTLDEERALEMLSCLFIKFNNHPAPPKVGITAAESGTYTDFANLNLGGLRRDGGDGSGPVSHLLLRVIEELHLLQPSNNVQISRHTPDDFLDRAAAVIRRGWGFPSVFNADLVTEELIRQGKSPEDAREGGTSGCVEAGAFGKEAYILTGYFNLPKLLELALNRGVDPQGGRQLGPRTDDPVDFTCFAEVVAAFEAQLHHFAEIKLTGNEVVEGLFARTMPAPFLSLLTDDCIAKGMDYNEGGARYNTSYLQGVGIGTLTDSLAAINHLVFETGTTTMAELTGALTADFQGHEALRQRAVEQAPKWGNDDPRADKLMQEAFELFHSAVDGRPNLRGGCYHINMLPTTSHVWFGSCTGATPDGRQARTPLSEGISPVQGRDRQGPTAVLLSAARMDQVRTGGTLLNLKFTPAVLEGPKGVAALRGLIRTYFELGGHHLQFNVVDRATLEEAQREPEAHRDLIVRVAGYSDYFCDLNRELQDEIIARTSHG